MKAMDPALFGYNTRTKPGIFKFSFDVRTLITGIAVNLGVMTVDQLEEIVSFRQTQNNNGMQIGVKAYYDPKYAGMKPISCVSFAEGVPVCAIQLGSVYAFPVFNHAGNNKSYPALCDCSELTAEALSDKTHNCNVFRFLSGFVFANNLDTQYMFSLVDKFGGSAAEINRLAHQPMFIASSFGQSSPFREVLTNASTMHSAYSFCVVGNVTCSVVTFASYDETPTNWAISDYYFQLQNGACRDTFTPSPANW
jgi:hypothetical protein